jgi:hypothetical protein
VAKQEKSSIAFKKGDKSALNNMKSLAGKYIEKRVTMTTINKELGEDNEQD